MSNLLKSCEGMHTNTGNTLYQFYLQSKQSQYWPTKSNRVAGIARSLKIHL